MILYRITTKAYARDLSGTGAMMFGGRWNPKGIQMLYTSQTLSLAMLEIIANLSGDQLHHGFYQVRLEFPDHLPLFEPALPDNWNSFPHAAQTVEIGQKFVKDEHLCMKVPSAIVPSEFNYLLNPMHDDFDLVRYLDANPILLDRRLMS